MNPKWFDFWGDLVPGTSENTSDVGDSFLLFIVICTLQLKFSLSHCSPLLSLDHLHYNNSMHNTNTYELMTDEWEIQIANA